MTAEATVNQLIADQNARANSLVTDLEAAALAAQLAAISAVSLPSVPPVSITAVTLPAWAPFAVDQTGEFAVAFNAKQPTFAGELSGAFSNFLTTYFPDIAGCIKTNSDNWICDMIVNGGNGIPDAVSQQIWDRARAKEEKASYKLIDEATNDWAGRGFALPPGALLARVTFAQAEAADKASTFARDGAIKDIEIQIENIRFAIEMAVKLRLGAVAAAVDYIKAFMLPDQIAIDYAKGLTDAHYRYFSAMDTYYQAQIGAARLTLDSRIASAKIIADNNKAFSDLVVGLTNARTHAAVGAATGLGQAAAAALGSLNSVANIGHNTAKSE